MIKHLLPFALLGLFGCPGGEDSVDSSADADADTDADSDADLSITAGFTATTLELTVANGEAGGYTQYGVDETAASSDPWTGEACMGGYTAGDGTVFDYCHSATATGRTLTYASRANAYQDLDADTETLFSQDKHDGRVTFYLQGAEECWVWGHDVSAYGGLGCTTLTAQ